MLGAFPGEERILVSDPYNSYGSHVVPITRPAVAQSAPAPAPTRPTFDRIAGLDVSDGWKRKFRLIEKAGGPDLPNFRDLPFGERFGMQMNFLAFFFGPIYYLIKGLWRQAVVYTVAIVVVLMVLEAMGVRVGRIGAAVGALYAVRANISYYKLRVLGEAPWI